MRLGVLDIGSNTVHLLLVDARPGGRPVPFASHKKPLQLVAYLDELGAISREGQDELVGFVREARAFATGHDAEDFLAFCTSAIREAANALGGWRLSGCTLYATLEPCPMCAGAAHAARLTRLVYAAPDPKAGYAGTLHDVTRDPRLNHTLTVRHGLLEKEAADLLRAFFKDRRKRPDPG